MSPDGINGQFKNPPPKSLAHIADAMFARSEGSLRPPRADLGRPASRGSLERLAKSSAPRSPPPSNDGADLREPQSVPAILRRHASRVHLPCIHMASRFSASANGNFQFSTEPATPISTPPASSQSEPPQPFRDWSCRFLSQHLIPLLLQTTHLPGNSKIGSQQKSQAKAWDLILSFPILAGDRARILTLWGRYFRRAPLPSARETYALPR